MTYIGAPYNFVSLPENVYERYTSMKELPRHNEIKEELLSGEISYLLEAESEIFVGGHNQEEFYRGTNGEYAIPGSSVRGLARNNVQILGLGSIGEDTEDLRLMYRKVGVTGALANRYKKKLLDAQPVIVGDRTRITVCKNVRAGYLKKQYGKYVIYKTKRKCMPKQFGEMNFYSVRENDVYAAKKKAAEETVKSGRVVANPYKLITDSGKMQLLDDGHNSENGDYMPYYMPVSYNLEGLWKITAIGSPGYYDNEGYVLSSGKVNKKKVFYVIPEAGSECIIIPECDVQTFQRDYEGKKNQLGNEQVQKFFALPEEGEIKPVFYIEYGKKLYFGFTQYLRVFYKHSIGDGIPKAHTSQKLDYAKAIFGFTSKTSAYKGRVYFEDAIIQKGEEQELEELMLESPKPSSYLDYLVQQGGSISTYDDPFEIRGFKQYWLKNTIMEKGKVTAAGSSKFRPLRSGTQFAGKVYFKNLAKDELGLLLWSLQLEKNSRQNIGKAKPYGYGKIVIRNVQIRLFDYSKMYTMDNIDFTPYRESLEASEYIKCYKKYIYAKTNRDIMEYPGIQEFFRMKDNLHIPDNSYTRYMSVEAEEYRNRKIPLCTPLQMVEPVRKQRRMDITVKKQQNVQRWREAIKTADFQISGKVEEGRIVTGEINGYIAYGVFVNLEGGESGLLHISKLKGVDLDSIKRTSPKGSKIKVKICSIDEKSGKKKITLDLPEDL